MAFFKGEIIKRFVNVDVEKQKPFLLKEKQKILDIVHIFVFDFAHLDSTTCDFLSVMTS